MRGPQEEAIDPSKNFSSLLDIHRPARPSSAGSGSYPTRSTPWFTAWIPACAQC